MVVNSSRNASVVVLHLCNVCQPTNIIVLTTSLVLKNYFIRLHMSNNVLASLGTLR